MRDAPVAWTTHTDGFGGDATVAAIYPGWASGPVRSGLRRLLSNHWLPQVRSENGDDAIGPRVTPPPLPDARVCRILIGSNRRWDGERFTAERAEAPNDLHLAEARVSVPNQRKRGEIPRPWSVLMVKGREDANKHILILEPPSLLEPDAFLATVKVNAVSGGFLFVHGYNTSLEGGLRRTAQLATDLDVKGPVFHYAWPSAANPLRYDYDGESVKVSSEPFKRFVKLLLEECGLEALNVVAHSKGNELVLDAFFDLAQSSNGSRGAQHLILASPDVDRSFGQQRLTSVPSYFASVTLYANKYDRPLLLSAGKAGGPRLGGMMGDRHPFIAKDVDSIDAANTDFGWFGLNHDAYVDAPVLMFDVKALLERGVRPPDIRNPVIRPKTCKRGTYYKVVTE